MEMQETLKPLKLKPFTADEIKPSGWLKKQLEIQAGGLTGNLDLFWPDIKDSKWIGGNCEGWERVPYWLDGFIPLAYLLDDEAMKSRAKRYIDAIIENQRPDGWICPCEDTERNGYDIWAVFLVCKVLVVYYECSKDERIEKVVYKALKNIYAHIDAAMIFNWARSRWFECLYAIFWLYERINEDWLPKLAHRLKAQGLDYHSLYESCPYLEKTEKGKWSFLNHVVNTAMAVKSGAWYGRMHGDAKHSQTADLMLGILDKYHGTVAGIFTGDENLAGRSPIQGTELCAVAELMYSIEQVYSCDGKAKWGDRLEYIAYNAYPATLSEDMWTHQYDQMVNQVECSVLPEEKTPFTTNGKNAHTFGLEPNYGCCTANMHQAFPKLALSTFMKTGDGIYSTVLAPSTLATEIKGIKVEISLDTEYPFKDRLEYTVCAEDKVNFAFGIRIPAWAKNPTVNGKTANSGEFHIIDKEWGGKETISVILPSEVEALPWDNNLHALKKGPLLYALKIESEWKKIDYGADEKIKVHPHCDYEIFPKSAFNYAIADTKGIAFTENGIGEYVFSENDPPIYAEVDCKKIAWDNIGGVIAEIPAGRTPLAETEKMKFIPYGCSVLRLTVLPILESGGTVVLCSGK
ncbi:MAG: glycoside hydrolase family 127 protein [Oscillospiraceae bacterium]|nr:glycoside hydrolase family 127 protein [Oscillospiraceae bacterium]